MKVGWAALLMVSCVRAGATPGASDPRAPHSTAIAIAYDDTFADMQIEIAKSIVDAQPVVILVHNSDETALLMKIAGDKALAQSYADGRLVVWEAPFESPWIRDYGPLSVDARGRTILLDATYAQGVGGAEARSEEAKLATIATQRDLTPEQLTKAAQEVTALETMERVGTRPVDDGVPRWFEVARAELLRAAEYRTTDVRIDGGNLYRLDGGACATSDAAFDDAASAGMSIDDVRNKLVCSKLIKLEPLPGHTIKHVDMFMAPAPNHTVLLADYAGAADSLLGARAQNAMQDDEAILQHEGFKVVRVPALKPSVLGTDAYYPTLMNILAVPLPDGRTRVLVPSYKDEDQATQEHGRAIIAAAFGNAADVRAIESTDAAHAFGAIHCLTTELPLASTPSSGNEDRTRVLTAATREQEQIAQDLAERDAQIDRQSRFFLAIEEHVWTSDDGYTLWYEYADTGNVVVCRDGKTFNGQIDFDAAQQHGEKGAMVAPVTIGDDEFQIELDPTTNQLSIVTTSGDAVTSFRPATDDAPRTCTAPAQEPTIAPPPPTQPDDH